MPKRRSASVFPYRGKFRLQYIDSFGRTRTKTASSRPEALESVSCRSWSQISAASQCKAFSCNDSDIAGGKPEGGPDAAGSLLACLYIGDLCPPPS